MAATGTCQWEAVKTQGHHNSDWRQMWNRNLTFQQQLLESHHPISEEEKTKKRQEASATEG